MRAYLGVLMKFYFLVGDDEGTVWANYPAFFALYADILDSWYIISTGS
jgi:hypothetical protein